MTEYIGFRTPAKEIESLRKNLEQMEDVSKYIGDAVVLSIFALAEIHLMQAIENPKNARKLKDNLLDGVRKTGISSETIDLLDEVLKRGCEYLEETMGKIDN